MTADTIEPMLLDVADASIAALDTQRVGRMGELVVELELLKRGWIVGNFNSATMNSAGWDLFATRGARSIKIRVKAKRAGVDCFRWSARADGNIFLGNTGQDDDWIAAVSFNRDGGYQTYLVPTAIVAATLRQEHARWLAGEKRGGGARKDTSMRHIYLDNRDDGTPGRGFAKRWDLYRDAWQQLTKVLK
jgi:hypothetical protein